MKKHLQCFLSRIRFIFSFCGISLAIFLLITHSIATAQNWQPMGPNDITSDPPLAGGNTAFTSLAVAPDGTTYIAYQDSTNANKATVKKWDGSAWIGVGDAGFSAGSATFLSLAISSTDAIFIAYQDAGNGGKATVKKWTGSSWDDVGTAGFSEGDAGYVSLAIAPDGTLYTAYSDGANSLKAAVKKFDGTDWIDAGNGFPSFPATYTSLAMAADGTPYVTYQDFSKSLKAAVKKLDGGTWVDVGAPGFSESGANYTKLAFAPDGGLYLGYSKNGATVMKWNGITWTTLGGFGFTPGKADYLSLVIGPDGSPFVGYSDAANDGKVSVKKWDGFSWADLGIPNFSKDSVEYTNLAILPNGTRAIIGYNSSSTYAKYYDLTTLPIRLLSFNTQKTGNDVELKWSATNEENTARFVIQRSTNGTGFVNIGEKISKGNSIRNNYSFVDNVISTGSQSFYYRLQMINKDGTYSFSDTRMISIANSSFSVWPNPARNKINFQLNGFSSGNYKLQIYDMQGRQVLQKNIDLSSSLSNQTLMLNLPAGVYKIRLGSEVKTLLIE